MANALDMFGGALTGLPLDFGPAGGFTGLPLDFGNVGGFTGLPLDLKGPLTLGGLPLQGVGDSGDSGFRITKADTTDPNAGQFRITKTPRTQPQSGVGQQAQAAGRAAGVAHRVPATVPAEYQAALAQAAQQYNVDPALLAAQLKQESGFNPAAVGPMTQYGQARGLGQFLPSTAARYGVDVNDPVSSINGMAHYMSDLLRQYNGNQQEALAAYNGGDGAVQRLRQGRPYQETQQYLAAVQQNLQGYQAMAAPVGASPGSPSPTDILPAMTSPFNGVPYRIAFDVGQRYTTPLSGGTTHHRGVDIVPTEGPTLGAPVTALAGGTVVSFRQGGDQGNAVVLQAADGTYHAYFHLLDPNTLAPGTPVYPGQQIGRMGQSGSEGFPHLHLEVRRNLNAGDPRGAVIDPLAYFNLR